MSSRFPSPQTELDGFLLVNGSVRLRLPTPSGVRRAELRLTGENLADTEYAYRPGYPMPGRVVLAGLIVGF